MARFTLTLIFCIGAFFARGQTGAGDGGTSNAEKMPLKLDSIKRAASVRLDSLQGNHLKLDSLQDRLERDNIVHRSNQKVDSIQSGFNQRSDSLKNAYNKRLSHLDSSQASLRKKLDSLATFNLPTNKISQKLDSLNDLRKNTTARFEQKLQAIKDKTSSKLKDLELLPELSEKVNDITKNIDGVKFPSSELNLPSLNLPANPLENAGGIGKLNELPNVNANNPLQATGITEKVGDVNIPGGDELKKLTEGQGNITEMSKVTDQVSEYSKEAQEIAKGNLDEAKNISQVAEEKAAEVSGINEIEKQAGGLDEYKAMTTKVQDPEALKKEAIDQVKKVAVNHFAGKEEALKAAMEKISKYKQKYSSLDGIKGLSKKRPNEMRNKPLIERIVPGIAMQYQKKGDNLLVDFNPYAGYRFTGRLRAGFGWNQRIGYNTKLYGFSPDTRVYGPRVFGEYKLGKGFSPRVEIEVMNTGIPPMPMTTMDPDKREWVWGAFVGIKKEYKIVKNVKGAAMIMTRLFNPEHKSPYADVLNVRFGFEFPMKKKMESGKK